MPYRKYLKLSSTRRLVSKASTQLLVFTVIILTVCLLSFDLTLIPRVFRRLENGSPLSLTSMLYTTETENELSREIPVYYINLNDEAKRREYIRDHLRGKEFKEVNRVAAWTVQDVEKYVQNDVTSIPNLLQPNIKEIACIASHLHAMHLAVTDSSNLSPYALIVEDDVKLELDVDWTEMIAQAPQDFTILQLTTSNSEAVSQLWADYVKVQQTEMSQQIIESNLRGAVADIDSLHPFAKHQWVERTWDSSFWSTQAYLIHKERLKDRLESFLSVSSADHHLHISLRNPDPQKFQCNGFNGACLLPFRIVADIMLYTMFPVSYMTRIPLFNGASAVRPDSAEGGLTPLLAESSTISDDSRVKKHREEFGKIEVIISAAKKEYSQLLPSYFHDSGSRAATTIH